MQPPPTPPAEFHPSPQSSALMRRLSQSSIHTTAKLMSSSPPQLPSQPPGVMQPSPSLQASSHSHPARSSPRHATQPATQSGLYPARVAVPRMSPLAPSSATALASSPYPNQSLHLPSSAPLPQSPINVGPRPFSWSQLLPTPSSRLGTQHLGTGIAGSPQLSQPTPQFKSMSMPDGARHTPTRTQQIFERIQAAQMAEMQPQTQAQFSSQTQSPSLQLTYPAESMAAAVAVAGAHNLGPVVQIPGGSGLPTLPMSMSGLTAFDSQGQAQAHMGRVKREADQGSE